MTKSKSKGTNKRECYTTLHKEPIPGVTVSPPDHPPGPHDVLLGYRLQEGPSACCAGCSCCVWPRPSRMNSNGWMSALLIAIIFTPLACLPCCMAKNYDVCQVPVYGPGPEA